jgi:acylphosphatase
MLQTVSIIVTGKVQGVYYRQSTKEKAVALGLNGEVSNRADGSVCIVATGSTPQLDQLVAWCRQGPPRARVEEVVVTPIDLKEFKGFSIVRF